MRIVLKFKLFLSLQRHKRKTKTKLITQRWHYQIPIKQNIFVVIICKYKGILASRIRP